MTEVRIRCHSLAGYPLCGRAWVCKQHPKLVREKGYELRDLPSSIGALVGTGFHAAGREIWTSYRSIGQRPPSIVLIPALGRAVEAMRAQRSEIEILCDDTTPTIYDAEKVVGRMVGVYHAGLPELEEAPTIVEERYECEVEPGVILSGQPDLVLAGGVIDDAKTGRMKPGGVMYQLGGYSIVLRSQAEPFEVTGLTCNWLPRKKLRELREITVHRYGFDQGSAEREALSVARAAARAVREFEETGDIGVFVANPSSFLCGEKYCPAFGTNACHAWREKRGMEQ